MYEAAELSDPFVHENGFYRTASPQRFGKLLSQYELFKRTLDVPGAIVECGVFKGNSLSRWALFRSLFSAPHAKEIVAFDTFGTYFPADTERDSELRSNVIRSAGETGVTVPEMQESLEERALGENVTLIPGNICETVPAFLASRPELKVSLLNVDVDFYDATAVILREFVPRLSKGAVLILDDYGVFEGETRAVDEMLPGVKVRKFPFAYSPSFVVVGA